MLNALFQVAAYAMLGYFYLTVLPGWLGLDTPQTQQLRPQPEEV